MKNISLLTLGGLASQSVLASNKSAELLASAGSVSNNAAKKQMGLQTYSLGQELLKDMPNGLQHLAKMGYTELEIFGYKEDSGKFGDYSADNTTFIAPKDYKKMVDDAGQIHVAWSNGSSLALNTEKDYFEAVITQEYLDQRRREAMEEKQNSRENPEESGSEITQNMM